MPVNDSQAYLNRIQKQFAEAKAKAEALVNPVQPRKRVKPVVDSIIPFDLHTSVNVFDVNHLASLNKDVPALDMTRVTANAYGKYPLPVVEAVVNDDEIQTLIPARPIDGEICILDWLSFTVNDTTFDDELTHQMTSETLRQNRIIQNLSELLVSILGFGVAEQMPKGINFYDRTWRLEHNAGFVCIGGQRGSVLIMINGTGCTFAKHGWQLDLEFFLVAQAVNPKITRIDLAYDDLDGSLADLAWYVRQYDKGGFTAGYRKPNIELRGNWKNPTGKGRTVYIGSPASPKYCRIYEKGKQLGDKSSPWVRCEVEFKAKGQFIPLDVLRKPSNFFVQAYPCFWLFNKENIASKKLERVEKEKTISFEKALDITRHQFGRYLWSFWQEFTKHGLTEKDLLIVLTTDIEKKYPDRLNCLSIPDYFKP